MFGLVSKKRLLKESIAILNHEDTSKSQSENDLYYRMGNANALNSICSHFGIDLTKAICEIHEKEFFEEETRKRMMDGERRKDGGND